LHHFSKDLQKDFWLWISSPSPFHLSNGPFLAVLSFSCIITSRNIEKER